MPSWKPTHDKIIMLGLVKPSPGIVRVLVHQLTNAAMMKIAKGNRVLTLVEDIEYRGWVIIAYYHGPTRFARDVRPAYLYRLRDTVPSRNSKWAVDISQALAFDRPWSIEAPMAASIFEYECPESWLREVSWLDSLPVRQRNYASRPRP